MYIRDPWLCGRERKQICEYSRNVGSLLGRLQSVSIWRCAASARWSCASQVRVALRIVISGGQIYLSSPRTLDLREGAVRQGSARRRRRRAVSGESARAAVTTWRLLHPEAMGFGAAGIFFGKSRRERAQQTACGIARSWAQRMHRFHRAGRCLHQQMRVSLEAAICQLRHRQLQMQPRHRLRRRRQKLKRRRHQRKRLLRPLQQPQEVHVKSPKGRHRTRNPTCQRSSRRRRMERSTIRNRRR